MEIPWTWVLLRSTGTISIVVLTVAVVAGLSGPLLRTPSRRLVGISMHGTAAAVGILLLVAHVALAVADSHVDIPPLAIFLPGASGWEPLWIGVGAAAVNLFLLVTLTAVARHLIPVSWRVFHVLALPAWALAWGHGLMVGSDAGTTWLRLTAVLCGAAVLAVGVLRTVRQPRGRSTEGLTPARPIVRGGRR